MAWPVAQGKGGIPPLVGFGAVVAGLAALVLGEAAPLRALGILVAGLAFLTMDTAALKRVLLAVVLFEIGFPIDTYIGYRPDTDHLNALSGFNVSVTTFLLVALYGLWLAEGLARLARPVSWRAIRPALVYTGVLVTSLLVARDATLGLFEVTIVVQALLLLVYVAHNLERREDVLFVFGVLAAALLFQSLLALAQWAFGFEILAGPVSTRTTDAGRVAGTVGSPNSLGSYLSLLLPVALVLFLAPLRRRLRLLGGAAFCLGLVALAASFSRGAWGGALASLAFLAYVAWRRGWVTARRLGALASIAALLIAGLIGGAITGRLSDTAEAAEGRLELMRLALQMIGDHPLLGVGSNNFAAALGPYVTDEFIATWISTVHNKYLLVWAETGLLGLLAFLWLLAAALRRGWQVVEGDRGVLALMALALVAGIGANMVQMFVELYHGRGQVQMLWIVVGTLLAAHRIHRREASSPRRPGGRNVAIHAETGASRQPGGA